MKSIKDWRQIPCPIERTATLLGDHYVIMIVRDLMRKPSRFSELERAGINPRTLSARLRHLTREGFIESEPDADHPHRGRYRLTDKGRAILPLIGFLREYGETWLPLTQPPG